MEAKRSGRDPFVAIEVVQSWDAFAESVSEAQKLAQPEDFDFLHHIGESYATLRRYAPAFLDVLKLRAAPAAKAVFDAIDVLRTMNADNARKVPADAPTGFIKKRWEKLVMFYTHLSDQYAPYHAKLVNVGVRDSTYVLDGLLYHESDLRIEEHYTDTAGFTDHVFALMHLLGFRFAPRIRDLAKPGCTSPKGKPLMMHSSP